MYPKWIYLWRIHCESNSLDTRCNACPKGETNCKIIRKRYFLINVCSLRKFVPNEFAGLNYITFKLRLIEERSFPAYLKTHEQPNVGVSRRFCFGNAYDFVFVSVWFFLLYALAFYVYCRVLTNVLSRTPTGVSEINHLTWL